MSDTTWAFWSIEYEIPNLNLVLVCAIDAADAATEKEAIACFRKRRPHGRVTKINGRPVKDDGHQVAEVEDTETA